MDVVVAEPVAAFCSSDEDNDEGNILQFLPIAPEIDDPEDVCGNANPEEEKAKENDTPSPPTKKPRCFDINLPNAPSDGIYFYFYFIFIYTCVS